MKMETAAQSINSTRGTNYPEMENQPLGRSGPPCLAHQALHQFLLDMVALVYEVEPEQLRSPTRGRKKTAFARQVAMYLAHTGGGLSLSCVGRLFKRDRTTVSHACALVEDARDDMIFDRTLGHLESTIACQINLFRLSSQNRDHRLSTPKGHQI